MYGVCRCQVGIKLIYNFQVGINAEHAWADATIISHLAEECFNWDIELGYDEDGNCKGFVRDDMVLHPPSRLRWDIPKQVLTLL